MNKPDKTPLSGQLSRVLDALLSRGPESEVAKLHPDFRIRDGAWFFNRDYNAFMDQGISAKAHFYFDDPALLNDCRFQAKIGRNLDPAHSQKYNGFAYARAQDIAELSAWAQRFPFAELMDHLNEEGLSTAETTRKLLKGAIEAG